MKLKPDLRPILAVTERDGIITEQGECYKWSELTRLLRAGPGILATTCSHETYLFLNDFLKGEKDWQVRIKPMEDTKNEYNPDLPTVVTQNARVEMLGFTAGGDRRKRSSFWTILDPTIYLDEASIGMDLRTLMAFAKDVRSWCADHGLAVKPTAGGVAAQLLRHPMFYPEDRRKVPRATNAKVRIALPGNHYELRAQKDKPYAAVYIDQESAHHNAARDVDLPDSDIVALGFFREPETPRPYCALGDLRGHGLLRARVYVPERKTYLWRGSKPHALLEEFRPDWAGTVGWHDRYIYTNELDYLHSIGGRVEYVTCAWLSPFVDEGIKRFAEWALTERRKAGKLRERWLKRNLLVTYGMLATKERKMQVAWQQAKSGDIRKIPIAGMMMPFYYRETSKPFSPRHVHVIQRGMIEAETRLRSIQFANKLLDDGAYVLHLYADAVLVHCMPWSTRQFDLLPRPWAVKERLTNVHFLSEQAFESDTMLRLPGVPLARRSARETAKVLASDRR